MEATIFNEIIPYMMYIFEPLRTCTMQLWTHHSHLWTLAASNGLHFQKKLMFSGIKCIFFSNLTPELHYTWLEDLKKVYCQGGSLEAKLASNGGHNWSVMQISNNIYFYQSQRIYNLSSNILWLFINLGSLQWPHILQKICVCMSKMTF